MPLTINEINSMLRLARDASRQAYVIDGRKFKVGATIQSGEGFLFHGNNIEFHPQSLTMCAERVALFKYIQMARHEHGMKGIAVYVNQPKIYTSCGPCLQAFSEFVQDPDAFTLVYSGENINHYKAFTLRDLFPHPYYHEWKEQK